MMKRNNDKQYYTRIVLLLCVLLAVGTLACVIVLGAGGDWDTYFSSSLVRSGMVYFMIGLCAMLLVLLVCMIIISYRASSAIREQAKQDKLLEKKDFESLKRLGVTKGRRDTNKEKGRFSMLQKIDKKMAFYKAPSVKKISLEEFCNAFRNYAAGTLGLYYTIEDIRRFVAGMSVTRLILLQGMSGTGKTSLAYAMGQFLDNESVIVPIQPMWKERSDLLGYFNEFTKKFNETTLLRKMYEAGYSKELYITVLDEVNISRIEYYFAEFLSLLEIPDPSSRYLTVVNDVWAKDPVRLKEGRIQLPTNMWFVGTANNDDSTFSISDKVYDRAMVLTLDHKCVPFQVPKSAPVRITYDAWCELVGEAKIRYELSAEMGRKIHVIDAYLMETFRISFGNRIMKQIREYVPVMIACGGTELGAIDDILSKKVLRKLEQQNPIHVQNAIEPLMALIDEQFGDGLPQCKEYLHRFEMINYL